MVFDDTTGDIIMFGGGLPEPLHSFDDDSTNATWAYRVEADNWTNATVPGSPPARSAASAVFDSRAGQIVLFGGHFVTGLAGNFSTDVCADTWAYGPHVASAASSLAGVLVAVVAGVLVLAAAVAWVLRSRHHRPLRPGHGRDRETGPCRSRSATPTRSAVLPGDEEREQCGRQRGPYVRRQ